METRVLNLTYQKITPHVGTICEWQMIYQLAFLWKTCGFISGASVLLSGAKQSHSFQLWVSPCWCLPVPMWSYMRHKQMRKTSPSWETLHERPLRITWALRQGMWFSLRDLSVWFKPIIFSNCIQSPFMMSAFSMIQKLSRLTI